ncbi:MAG: S9 family peptidase [Gemmatimonadaceae bacterium]
MMNIARRALPFALLTLAASAGRAQQAATALSVDRIFASRDFVSDVFGPAAWLGDGRAYTTVEPSKETSGGSDLVRYDAESGARSILVAAAALIPPGATAPLAIESYSWSADSKRLLIFTNSARVWRDNTRGDFWVLQVATRGLSKLGGDAKPSTLMFAKFSPSGDRVAYVRENDIYVESLADHRITRLTSDGSRTTINGTTDWVYEEELGLRDAFRWSPDGTRIAYWQLDASGVRDFLMINNTDSLYSYTIPVQYPKVGTTNSAARIGVVSTNGGATTWFRAPGDPRNNYIARMEWAPDGKDVVFQHLNRKQNTLTLFAGNAASGDVRPILVDQDTHAWVDIVDDFIWLDGGKSFTWLSERDGWRHLYVYSRELGTSRLVTNGEYDVARIARMDPTSGWVYFIASPTTGTQRFLYRVPLDGKKPAERLTPAGERGTHGYDVSPTGRFAFHNASSFGTPPVVDLIALPTHQSVRTLAANTNVRNAVGELVKGPMEFIRVPIGDGVELDGYLMKPPGFDPGRKYPVLFHVYGEPAGQTVADVWGSRNYLWHLMLTQQGYIVASVDNRGTPSLRGSAWRKAIYGKIGILNSADQAAAVKQMLRTYSYLDSSRVGVWGWSGGGSMTLNLMFRSPELYKVGLSVAPVGDQHNYDSIYQERYMGLPSENEDAFRQGSPITFASQLKGKLLLVHGTGDDNVHYQNSEQIVNALVRANRPFTMMSYPNRSHGIFEGEGTTRHLYTLLTRYLNENLAPGAAPIP